MDSQNLHPIMEILEQSPAFKLQILLSIIILGVFYWDKFNTWTSKEDYPESKNPPRHFTTWAKYFGYALIYTLCLELAYLLILAVPDILDVINKVFKLNFIPGDSKREFFKSYPLWVLVFMIGVLPNIPGLRSFEENLRYGFHQRAFIPEEARSLVQQFAANPAFFRPNIREAKDFIENRDLILKDVDAMRSDNRIGHKWFKLSFLRAKIEKWRGSREATRFISKCEKDYRLTDENYNRLRTDIKLYYDRKAILDDTTATGSDQEYLTRLQTNMTMELDRLLVKTYQVISCGVLATERKHANRLETFRWFGFHPEFKPGIPIVIDIILASAGAVLGIVFVMTLIYLTAFGRTGFNVGKALAWGVLYTVMVGFCILAAALLYRRLTRKSRFFTGSISETFVVGPFAHRVIGAGTGYLTAFVILVSWSILFSDRSLIDLLPRLWPWPLIPAAASGFVIYYLSSLDVSRNRWFEGLLQGSVTACAALVACIIAIEYPWKQGVLPFIVYATCVGVFSGFAIGYIFPEQYRRRTKNIYSGPERRRCSRVEMNAECQLDVGNEHHACVIKNLSLSGVEVNAKVSEGEGTTVILSIPELGDLQGVIARKTDTSTCMKLHLDGMKQDLLRNYIGPQIHSSA